ncbi:MAG: hypothetical protein ACFFFH_17970 [Candidatus Thorarchaeota archaeon]
MELNRRDLLDQTEACYKIIENIYSDSSTNNTILSIIEQILRNEKDRQNFFLM